MNYDDDLDPNDVQAEAIAGVMALAVAGVFLWGLWRLAEWLLTVRVLG